MINRVEHIQDISKQWHSTVILFAFIFGIVTITMQEILIVEEEEQRTSLRFKQVGFSWKDVLFLNVDYIYDNACVLIVFFIFYGEG